MNYPTAMSPRPHPIHGILSAFPLTFFTGALVTDVIYVASTQMQWATFSAWQIAFGLVGGVLAAIAGIVDAVIHRGRARRRPWPHSVATMLMMAFALVNIFIHSRDAWTSVMPTGLILSVISTVLAFVSSWLGYSLEARQEAR